MEKLTFDLTPNMYDSDRATIEDHDSMTTISLEDLDADQTIGDDNVDEPLPPEDNNFIYDDEDNQDEDAIEEGEELSVFGNEVDADEEGDDDDDTGFSEDDYEDMSEDDE